MKKDTVRSSNSVTFVRLKHISGIPYAFLVESRWNPRTGRPGQHVVKYLGALDRIGLDDIPSKYQSDRVIRTVRQYGGFHAKERTRTVAKLRNKIPKLLLSGDKKKVQSMIMEASGIIPLSSLYIDVIGQIQQEIGELWHQDKISVAEEHMSTNILRSTIQALNMEVASKGRHRGRVLLCVPEGEEHTMGLLLIEGLLLEQGFTTTNIAGSLPSDIAAAFAEEHEPSAILISWTTAPRADVIELIEAAAIASPSTPIVLGGSGAGQLGELSPNVVVQEARENAVDLLHRSLPKFKRGL